MRTAKPCRLFLHRSHIAMMKIRQDSKVMLFLILLSSFICTYHIVNAIQFQDMSYEDLEKSSYALSSEYAVVKSAEELYGIPKAKEVSTNHTYSFP